MTESNTAMTRDITTDVLQFEQTLSDRGDICIGSGVLIAGSLSVSLHTSFGPPDLDKDCNQDFVIGWKRHSDSDTNVELAVAMTDGVTSSYRSEVGAETACWAALSSLVSGKDVSGRTRAELAVAAANEAIEETVERIRASPESYCPEDEFESTWDFRLTEGLLLQSTLTLLWVENGSLFIAIVGDSGALLSAECESGKQRLAFLNVDLDESQAVNALGPHRRGTVPLDCYAELEISLLRNAALFTDGNTRGFGEANKVLELILQTNAASPVTNVVKDVIDSLVERRPKEFQDNLTLCWLSTGPPVVEKGGER